MSTLLRQAFELSLEHYYESKGGRFGKKSAKYEHSFIAFTLSFIGLQLQRCGTFRLLFVT